jgi:hypothetical protein
VCEAAEQQGAHGDDHGLGRFEAPFVVEDEAARADQPVEGERNGLVANDKFCLRALCGCV